MQTWGEKPYHSLDYELKQRFGEKVYKLTLNGGMSCPNRDGKVGTGGCIFCGERGAGEHIDPTLSIKAQVENALCHAEKKDKFIAYFQNFTNTYAPVSTLKERYDAALIDGRIKVLAIGTRPDCITREVAELIASYKDRCDVWVEMGLQTSNDLTAKIINRGYKTERFTEAVSILKEYDIDVVAHIIAGLPGESKIDVINTAKYIKNLGIWGVKIHSIYVMKGTKLEDLYLQNLYTPPTLSDYVDTVCDVLSVIPKNMVVHRITGDCPKDLLVAPDWNKDKNEIIKMINEELTKRELRQGCN